MCQFQKATQSPYSRIFQNSINHLVKIILQITRCICKYRILHDEVIRELLHNFPYRALICFPPPKKMFYKYKLLQLGTMINRRKLQKALQIRKKTNCSTGTLKTMLHQSQCSEAERNILIISNDLRLSMIHKEKNSQIHHSYPSFLKKKAIIIPI